MEKKKILVTASTFPRWEGDTEPRFVYDLAEALADRYDITVLAPAAIGAKDREEMGRLHVVRYHYFPVHKWETLCYPGAIVPRIKEKKVRMLLVPCLLIALFLNIRRMQNNFDMIHTHWIIPQGLVQCLFRKPYLVTGHGGDVTSLNIGPLKKWKQLCLKRAGYCTAVSEKLKRIMLEICPEARISVIPMGCDTKAFGRKHRIENYFDQGNHKMILFVGRLAEKKGVTYLIKAMKEIDGKLAIVGQGPLENQLKEQVVQEGLEQKIVFLGSKTHEELRSIYASADIFVMPSITAKDGDEEGFGLVMLEAMASGLPIVASSSGGIVDLIHHEDTGLLVEEKDVDQLAAQINRLCYDDSLYKELQQSSIKHVQAYDYKIIAQRYYDIIEGIMKGKTVKDE